MRIPFPTLRSTLRLSVFCLSLVMLTGNCTLGPLQALIFHFTVGETVTDGSTDEVHKAFYPVEVVLKRYFVRLSGHIDTKGEPIPAKIAVAIVGEDQVTGKKNQRVNLNLKIRADGSFTATKRIKKNIPAGTVQKITAKPTGADIPSAAEVWICIDIAKKKSDLAPASECSGATGGGPVDGIHIVEVLDDAFEPKRLRIQAGDTVRWVLRGDRDNHTTTEMNSTWDSGFTFSSQGDFFEHTFGPETNNSTLLYSCQSHKDCCEMQGSIQVGDDAPSPEDDY